MNEPRTEPNIEKVLSDLQSLRNAVEMRRALTASVVEDLDQILASVRLVLSPLPVVSAPLDPPPIPPKPAPAAPRPAPAAPTAASEPPPMTTAALADAIHRVLPVPGDGKPARADGIYRRLLTAGFPHRPTVEAVNLALGRLVEERRVVRRPGRGPGQFWAVDPNRKPAEEAPKNLSTAELNYRKFRTEMDTDKKTTD